MHQKLRSLDNCLRLLYHIVGGQTHTWSESNPRVKDAVKLAKKECIDHISKNCGFLVDCPTSIGGNTNTGPVAQKFFSPQHRANIVSLIRNTQHRIAFAEVLSNFNKLLPITQCSDRHKVVHAVKVKELGQQLMVHYKLNFPFAMLSPSVHQMAAHSWQLFEMVSGQPIAVYAEQSSEAWNKYIRAYKSGAGARARQCSIKLNTRDIFVRMLLQSHPITASKRKMVSCKKCKEYGHTVRSCPLNLSYCLESEQSDIDSCYFKY